MAFIIFRDGVPLDAVDLNFNFAQVATITGFGSDTSTNTSVPINGAVNQPRKIYFQTAGVNQFSAGIHTNDDFIIERYNDAGGLLGVPFKIAQATGLATFIDAVEFGGAGENKLTLTPGATSTDPITFVQSGSGGLTFNGAATITSNSINALNVTGGAVFGPSDYKQVEIHPDDTIDGGPGSPHTLRIRRVGSDASDGGALNLWVTRSSWVQTNTATFLSSPGLPRFNFVADTGQLPGSDAGSTWNLLSTIAVTSSEYSQSAVSAYIQAVRSALPTSGRSSIGAPMEGAVIELRDATGASSATGGVARTLELDMFVNGADDYVGSFGGIGREVATFVLGKANSGGTSPTITSVMGIYPVIGDGVQIVRGITWANQLNYSASLFDTRDSVQGAGANAIWLKSGHRIAFDGVDTATSGSSSQLFYNGTNLNVTSGFSADAGLVSGTNTFTGVGLQINGSAASTRQIRWLEAGTLRGALGMSGTAGDLNFNRYLDTGTLKETALSIPRRTGFVTATKAFNTSDRVITPKIQNSAVTVSNVTALSGNGTTITCTHNNGTYPVGGQVRLANNTPTAYDGLYIVATSGVGTFTALGTATGTVTEFGVVIFYSPISANWTGATYPNDFAASVQRYTPTGTPASGITAYNYWAASVDDVDATNTAGVPTFLRMDYNFGGANLRSGRFGIHVNMNQASAMTAHVAGGPVGGDFIPGAFHCQVSFNNGGTGHDIIGLGPNNAYGGVYALYPQIIANAGATFWDHFIGAEWDFQIRAGAEPNHKIGQQIVQALGDAAQGVYDDIAFSINGDPTAIGWRVGLAFGRAIAPMSMDPAGTLIAIVPQMNASHKLNTLKNGIDFELGRFTGNAFSTAGGFNITGTGNLNVGPVAYTRATTAGVIDAKRYKVTGVAVSSSGALYTALDEIGILGGTLQVATVLAGGITGVNIVKDIYADTPPANPIGGAGGGGGDGRIGPTNQATFNLTWTQVTDLQINPSGGQVIFGGAIATPVSVTKTTNFTMGEQETNVICNGAGSITVTLPSAATHTGQWRVIRTIAAQTVVSNASNVIPLAGGAAGTAILAATAGKYAYLQSNGINWEITLAN